MKVYYDTEFLEDGRTIDLISIGMVREDGEEYYAVNSDADWDRIKKDAWLLANVWPNLPVRGLKWENYSTSTGLLKRVQFAGFLDDTSVDVKPKWVIRNEVREFLLGDEGPELWAWYGAYDHVALAQLWGKMIGLPKGIPMWTNDLRQERLRLGDPEMPEQVEGQHNALEDARWLAQAAAHLASLDGPT